MLLGLGPTEECLDWTSLHLCSLMGDLVDVLCGTLEADIFLPLQDLRPSADDRITTTGGSSTKFLTSSDNDDNDDNNDNDDNAHGSATNEDQREVVRFALSTEPEPVAGGGAAAALLLVMRGLRLNPWKTHLDLKDYIIYSDLILRLVRCRCS